MAEEDKVLEKEIKHLLKKSLFLLKSKKATVEIYLVSNVFIKDLNRKFRGQNRVTGVLAFPNAGFPRPDKAGRHLGEIYLAPDYIRSKKENIYRLAIHGLLHLLGFSHRRNNDRIKMEKEEKWLMSLQL